MSKLDKKLSKIRDEVTLDLIGVLYRISWENDYDEALADLKGIVIPRLKKAVDLLKD